MMPFVGKLSVPIKATEASIPARPLPRRAAWFLFWGALASHPTLLAAVISIVADSRRRVMSLQSCPGHLSS